MIHLLELDDLFLQREKQNPESVIFFYVKEMNNLFIYLF